MAGQELFTIPIAALENHPGGTIVCTAPAPQVYLLTWTSPPDNRLTQSFCQGMIAALNELEFSRNGDNQPTYTPGVVLTTSGIAKFYSNGLDLSIAGSLPKFFEDNLFAMWKRFLNFPMPTIALFNGHAFAGGAMTGMYHDYRVFSEPKGYLCLNELEFGAPLLPAMASIWREKCSPAVYRKLILEAHRYDAKSALQAGIVDKVGGLEAALELIKELKLVGKAKEGSYGMLRQGMYCETAALLDDAIKPLSLFGREKTRIEAGVKKLGADNKAKL